MPATKHRRPRSGRRACRTDTAAWPGCVLPLLPISLFDLELFGQADVRFLVPFPFGVAGLVLGIVGATGRRRGLPMAVIGVVLSIIALAFGVVMAGYRF